MGRNRFGDVLVVDWQVVERLPNGTFLADYAVFLVHFDEDYTVLHNT